MNSCIPSSVKGYLKPYYRKFLPNKLHLIFWPTFRCNYKCSYCPYITQQHFPSIFTRGKERSTTEWLEAINKLPPAVFFIAGGEPFLYRGLIDFLNEMPEKHEVLGIVTNLTVNEKIYKKIKRKINFNVSFHREYISVDKLLEKSKELRKNFPVTVYLVATPENIPEAEKLSGKYRAGFLRIASSS